MEIDILRAVGLIGYVRVSRIGEREGEGYISPAVQRDSIAAYAAEMGETIDRFADDQDFSGGTTERPAFQAALAALERGEAEGIVVMRIDRFARSVADGARIIREITDRGQVFASCHERIDPRTPEGRFMLTSFLANAELFLDQSKAGWQTAKARAIARGVPVGKVAFGYHKEPSMPLVPDPETAPIVTELFRRAASGRHSDTDLAVWISEQVGHHRSNTIRRWLENRVYLGEIRYGSLVNAAAHPPLTDPETWQRAQRTARSVRRGNEPFMLRGLVRCAGCRRLMGVQSYGGGRGTTPIYRCYGQECPEPAVIIRGRIEPYVTGLLTDHVAGLRLIGRAAGRDLAALDRAEAEAEAELLRFASDLDARRLLGEVGWREALGVRAADRDVKARARERGYEEASLAELVEDVGSLGHDDLGDALAAMAQAIFVRRGRGMAVERRVLVLWCDQPAVDLDICEPVRW